MSRRQQVRQVSDDLGLTVPRGHRKPQRLVSWVITLAATVGALDLAALLLLSDPDVDRTVGWTLVTAMVLAAGWGTYRVHRFRARGD